MTHRRKVEAFTRTELAAVIVVVVLIAVFCAPSFMRAKQRSGPNCVNNLRQIGTAYRIWSNDNGDKYPANTPMTNGGWSDFLQRKDLGAYGCLNYIAMANELGKSSRALICPADERKPAVTFGHLANTNISYFVGVDANDTYPQAILGGDRNLGPGTTPDTEYGYSPSDGRGNDVVINGPVCWSLKMHSRGNNAGAGNILLGDGSAQQTTSGNLSKNWLKSALEAKAAHDKTTNAPGIRLIFP